MAETTIRKEVEVIQQPEQVDFKENESTVDEVKNTENQQVIQHTPRHEGESVDVERIQSEEILQNEQSIATKETYQLTSSLALISQQEAFTGKYQPVEVLNDDGMWVSGYFVHKCLVVVNLAGIERKYA